MIYPKKAARQPKNYFSGDHQEAQKGTAEAARRQKTATWFSRRRISRLRYIVRRREGCCWSLERGGRRRESALVDGLVAADDLLVVRVGSLVVRK